MKSLKNFEMIKRQVKLHPRAWIKYFISFILSISLLLMIKPIHAATIEDHLMCAKYEESPEGCSPPQEKKVFRAGDIVCNWLRIDGVNRSADGLKWRWYQPDGSSATPSRLNMNIKNDWDELKTCMRQCYLQYGEDSEEGIPNIPGEWRVAFHDISDNFIYEDTFTVTGDGTTSISSSSTTTTVSNVCPPESPIDCGDGTCCFIDYPVCGRGLNSDFCFEEGTNPYFPDCPILTLYGADSKEVRVLRDFRDNILNTNPEGQALIDLYYQWSPVIVKAIEQNEDFKQEIKEMVDDILPLISQ